MVAVLRLALVALVGGGVLLASATVVGPLTGHRAVVLRSGSMAPDMPVGSLVIIESVAPDAIRVGDVVTVQLDSGALLTHRVVRETSGVGYPALVLHGDANPAGATETISLDRLAGRVLAVIPFAGYAAWWLAQPWGVVAYGAAEGLALLAIAALGRRGARRRHRRWWRLLRGSPLRAPAAVLERGLWLGLDRPALALLLVLAVAGAGGQTLQSAALFTASDGIAGNTFTTGSWPASDYRSVTTGPWGDPATWERYNGTAWVAATRPPASIDGVVTIRTGHTVTVASDAAVDQVVVETGALLLVADSVVLTVADGPGTDLDIFGMVDTTGSTSLAAGAEAAIEAGALLQDSGTIDGPGSITAMSGTIQANGGARSIGNAISLSPGLTVAGSDDLRLDGPLTSGTLTKNGSGTLTLGAANTYTGATTVNAGTVALGIANAIGPSSAVTVAAGAVLDLHGWSDTIGSLAGAGTVTSSVAGGVTLTVGGDGSGSGTFSGVLQDGSGQLALAKIGAAGTLVLSGVNTYSGPTTISAGRCRC
ncbi:MAG: signal peptidase I [Candidatus Limnocylindrales bacterium]